MPPKNTKDSVASKTEKRSHKERGPEDAAGTPTTQPASASGTVVNPDVAADTARVPSAPVHVGNEAGDAATGESGAGDVPRMPFEEFIKSAAFKDADFVMRCHLVSAFCGPEGSQKFLRMVAAAPPSVPDQKTANGELPNTGLQNQESSLKRTYEDIDREQDDEIDALEAGVVKKRKAVVDVLREIHAKLDAQLERHGKTLDRMTKREMPAENSTTSDD